MRKETTMQRLSLLLIIGVAAGCDTWTSQPYVQGCSPNPNSSVLASGTETVDPLTGECIGRGGGTGGTNGGGGTGGGGDIFPPLDGETNLGTCGSDADPANDNCDYGCMALGNTFGFIAVLGVATDESLAGGSETPTEFDGFFVVSEAFVQGASEALGVMLTAAEVPEGAVLPITALEGATGSDLVLTLQPQTLDLTEDTNGNGVPGPFLLPFEVAAEIFTYGESGSEACFNLTNGIEFVFQVTEPFPIPATFRCQPADQELINQDNVSCMDDSDCLAPSVCDTGTRECTAVIEPDPTAGQVCFTIP